MIEVSTLNLVYSGLYNFEYVFPYSKTILFCREEIFATEAFLFPFLFQIFLCLKKRLKC